MKPDNPAAYECEKSKNGLHTWQIFGQSTATCTQCGLALNEEQTHDVVRGLEESIIAV